MNIIDGTTEFHKLAELPTGEWCQAGQERCLGGQLPMTEQGYNELRDLRIRLLLEEFNEYRTGEGDDDIVEIVDGLLDIIVIAWGSLLAYVGEEKANAAAAEVVRSNLSKVDGSIGPIIRRYDGKLLKPESWVGPDIRGALGL